MPTAVVALPGTAEDAIVGVVPTQVVRPTSVAEVCELLRAAHRDGRTVLAAGGRTKLGWAPPPSSADLLVDTTGLARVVEHTAGDLVAVAEAGVRLTTLQEQLGTAGQWLALDPAEPGATLGGILSANASGPRRLRYGTVRDLLIGVTVVLADGTVAHAGETVGRSPCRSAARRLSLACSLAGCDTTMASTAKPSRRP